jgi:hypothetical protein
MYLRWGTTTSRRLNSTLEGPNVNQNFFEYFRLALDTYK